MKNFNLSLICILLLLVNYGMFYSTKPNTAPNISMAASAMIVPDVVIDITFSNTSDKVMPKETEVEQNTKPEYAGKKLFGKYTPYQILAWHLKAHEGFSATPYPDGKYNSIGFGFNYANKHMAKKELADNYVTWTEATILMQRFLEQNAMQQIRSKYPKETPFQHAARAAHAYNTGKFSLGGCCGRKVGCGRVGTSKYAKAVRKMHTERRNWENRLYAGKITEAEILADINTCNRLELKHMKHK